MGKILSIDYGRKRIGLAMSDESEFIAFALTHVSGTNSESIFQALIKKISQLSPDAIVIGDPLGIDLKPTQMSLEVDKFIEKLLRELPDMEIIKWNEVGTSKIAQGNIRISGKKDIDSESARIILQEYLDFKKSK